MFRGEVTAAGLLGSADSGTGDFLRDGLFFEGRVEAGNGDFLRAGLHLAVSVDVAAGAFLPSGLRLPGSADAGVGDFLRAGLRLARHSSCELDVTGLLGEAFLSRDLLLGRSFAANALDGGTFVAGRGLRVPRIAALLVSVSVSVPSTSLIQIGSSGVPAFSASGILMGRSGVPGPSFC